MPIQPLLVTILLTDTSTKTLDLLKALGLDLVSLANNHSFDYRQQGIIKGDARSASIAAASIIAKVTRDRIMREYHAAFPQYGFYNHKGYATREHLESLKRYGPCAIHRKSFYPVMSLSLPFGDM